MKKKIALIMLAVLMFSTVLASGVFAANETLETASNVGVKYKTHIQDIGWETDWKEDGMLSGTVGKWKRLEALRVELEGSYPSDASIETYVHAQNYGDMGPFKMGEDAGTSGEGLRLENIRLVLKNLPGYTLVYNVQVQNKGWLRDENDTSTWFQSGDVAGTFGQGLRLEGIRIELVTINEAYLDYLDALAKVDEDEYTIDSWNDYQRIVRAYSVTAEDSQDLIELATDTILEAQKNLVKGMNLKKYKEALAQVSEENYTPESWDTYQEVVSRNVVSQLNSQSEIDTATKNILTAQKLLEGKVNMTAYLEILESVRETDYTALSWWFYQNTLKANEVSISNTQTEVDEAVANIEAAQKKLVRKFDFTAYNALLEAVKEEDYKTISWVKYQKVIDNNKVTENDTQSKIEEAILAIEEAQNGLEKGSDLVAYNAVLELVDQYSCTTDSWEKYQKVVDKYIVSKDSPQEDVDEAAEKILEAQLKLVGLGDLSEYLDALDRVFEEDYTTKSWATYQKVVKSNVVTEASGQTAINAATKKILDAQLKLELAGILTDYEAQLAVVSQEDWTSSSWATYQKVLDSNMMTRDNSQTEINEAISKIRIAQAKLVPKGDVTEFEALINSVSQDDYTVDSWTDYRKTLMKYYVTDDNSQIEIDEAVIKIRLAQMELVEKGDLTAYLELVDAKRGMQDSYTTASWAEYLEVLDDNEMTTENTDSEIELAIQRIRSAQDKLVEAADLTYYNEELNKYKGLGAEYTPDSWAAYQLVILQNLVTKDNTQDEVNTATTNIYQAGLQLVRATDLTAFRATLDLYQQEKKDGGVANKATTATWDDYVEQVEKYADFDGNWDWINTGSVNENSSQDAIDAATAYIQTARNNLAPSDALLALAYSNYQTAIHLNVGDSEEDFTVTAYSLYENEIENWSVEIPVILEDPDYVTLAATKIAEKKDDLQTNRRATDLSAFDAEVAAYQTLLNSRDNYTDSSWANYKTEYDDYYGDPRYRYTPAYYTQSEFDVVTKAMRDARIALELKAPTVATVAAQLTAEALQVEAYRGEAVYHAGIVTGEDLQVLAEALIFDKYGYGISVVDPATPANENITAAGVVNGNVGDNVVITFKISDGIPANEQNVTIGADDNKLVIISIP